jgi:hypothetical protein
LQNSLQVEALVRRIEPAYPDLFPVTHVVRPGYLPGSRVTLDPIRLGVVWEDAPQRVLPTKASVPRHPVRALVFSRVARDRQGILSRLLDRGSSVLVVLDDPELAPNDLGLDGQPEDASVTMLLPVLPAPLNDNLDLAHAWKGRRWGAMLGLFPFPGSGVELERRIEQLKHAGASFDRSFFKALPYLLFFPATKTAGSFHPRSWVYCL